MSFNQCQARPPPVHAWKPKTITVGEGEPGGQEHQKPDTGEKRTINIQRRWENLEPIEGQKESSFNW